MPKRRSAGGTKKAVGVKVDSATFKRLIKASDEFHAAIIAVAAVCTGRPQKPRKRRKPRK